MNHWDGCTCGFCHSPMLTNEDWLAALNIPEEGAITVNPETTQKLFHAAQLCIMWHFTSEETRKASVIFPAPPYAGHPLEVAGMVMNTGGPVEAVAAALLHDSLENAGELREERKERIYRLCGSEVLALVEECTEKGTEGKQKAPWRDRKKASLSHIQYELSLNALHITLADKTHNMRDLKRKMEYDGLEETMKLFRGGDTMLEVYDAQKWYYQGLRFAMAENLHGWLTMLKIKDPLTGHLVLLDEYSELVRDVFGEN